MKDILDSKMLAETVFGLNEDSFMLTVAFILIFFWCICLGLAVVFRENKEILPAPPVTNPSKASRESTFADSDSARASTKNFVNGTAVECEQHAGGERVVSEVSPKITNELSTIQQKAIQTTANPIH